jgi:prepilin-type N-terminal cleavage/methylation domain-containing protein
MTPRRLGGEDGFTLAELLVAFAILALALAAIVGVQQTAQRAYLTGDRKAEVQQNARFALERLADEIRQATAVTAATASSITFAGPAGVVTYTLNQGALTRNDVALIGGVAALTFAYHGANDALLGVPVGAPASVRRVDVTIRTRSEDSTLGTTGAYQAYVEVTTSARPRNL